MGDCQTVVCKTAVRTVPVYEYSTRFKAFFHQYSSIFCVEYTNSLLMLRFSPFSLAKKVDLW